MARKFATDIDLAQNHLLNAVLQNLAAAPGTPKAGQAYWDTTLNQVGVWNGTAWVYLTTATVVAATATVEGIVQLAGDLAGTGSTAAAPTVGALHLTGDTNIGHKLTGVTDPTNPQDAATKNYVDTTVQGLSPKAAVDLATVAALPANTYAAGVLTATTNGVLTVDGTAVTLGMRVLVKNEAAPANNGIYLCSTAGAAGAKYILTRTVDSQTWAELVGGFIPVAAEGGTLGDTIWMGTVAPGGTLGTTAVGYTQIQSATQIAGDGAYTTRVGNLLELIFPADVVLPANGAVAGSLIGAARTAKSALTGDGATTTFTITHNFGHFQYGVVGQQAAGANAGAPIELDWAPGTLNTVVITFPTAPLAGVGYFVTVIE